MQGGGRAPGSSVEERAGDKSAERQGYRAWGVSSVSWQARAGRRLWSVGRVISECVSEDENIHPGRWLGLAEHAG